MALLFSSIVIFFSDRGGRAMYWERASRVLEDPAGSSFAKTGRLESVWENRITHSYSEGACLSGIIIG